MQYYSLNGSFKSQTRISVVTLFVSKESEINSKINKNINKNCHYKRSYLRSKSGPVGKDNKKRS